MLCVLICVQQHTSFSLFPVSLSITMQVAIFDLPSRSTVALFHAVHDAISSLQFDSAGILVPQLFVLLLLLLSMSYWFMILCCLGFFGDCTH